MATQVNQHDISTVIADTRATLRFTMREFAAALNVSPAAVNLWEKGSSEPSLDRVETWLADPREWVYRLAFNILVTRLGPALLAAAAQPVEA